MNLNPHRVLVLTQPAAAVAKVLTVDVGFRPAVAEVVNLSGTGAAIIAVDGQNGGLKIGDNGDRSAIGAAAGITFFDQGIKLGTDAQCDPAERRQAARPAVPGHRWGRERRA